jgi:hypothetical protein
LTNHILSAAAETGNVLVLAFVATGAVVSLKKISLLAAAFRPPG